MKKKRWILFTLGFGALIFFLSSWNASPKTAEAACGASTSSCKTCHEVQGQLPVSKKGDWHTQHAFGDFCQACHLGVATENDKTKAHAGMIAKPLTQPQQSCASCHPSDTAARVAKYGGTAPGGNASGSTNSTTPASSGAQSQVPAAVSVSPAATQIPPSANPNFDLIDFNKYMQGKMSWFAWMIGILNVLILMVLLGLIWRWKKGVWPWVYFKRKGHWINLSVLPTEAQQVVDRTLKSEVKTVMAINEIFACGENSEVLFQAVAHLPQDKVKRMIEAEQARKSGASANDRGGEEHEL